MKNQINKPAFQFINGEPYARYHNVLMDEAGCKEIWGYEEELDMVDDTTIFFEDTLYTNHSLDKVIKMLSTYQGETPEYDEVLSKGYGFAAYVEHSNYDNTYILHESDMDVFEGIKHIKPFKQFKIEHPEINVDAYLKYDDELAKYYQSLR